MASEAVRYLPNYTADDYRTWEGDWELWDGVPVCMSPSPTTRHQMVAARLFGIVLAAIDQNQKCDCIAVYETDWQVNEHTVVRPDISVLCRGLPEPFIDYPPALITEVLSLSTADKDRTAKRQLYEQQGVTLYLLIDPDAESVELLHLTKSGYAAMAQDAGCLQLKWAEDCSATLNVSDLFVR